MYSWKELDANAITNLYLYGDINTPEDLANEELIRPKEYVHLIYLDAVSFMTNGPGRFAYGALSPVVAAFMSGISVINTGTRQEFTLSEIKTITGLNDDFTLWQSSYFDGIDDHALRTYIYQTEKFSISEAALFVIEADGTRHIENFAVRPYDENFDFDGGWLSNLGNAYIEPIIDPFKIGRTIEMQFDETSKNAIPLTDYTSDRFMADGLSLLANYNPFTGSARLAYEIPLLIDDLWTSGAIQYIDPEGRIIVYGSDGTDLLDATSVLGNLPLISPLRIYGEMSSTGVRILGGDGSDYLRGGRGNDYIAGGNDDDVLDGGGGDDIIEGGAGNDVYILKPGDGIDTIEDKLGDNFVILNGRIIADLIKKPDGTMASADGLVTARMDGTALMVTDVTTGTSAILNTNFQDGDFGIHIREAPTSPEVVRTIIGDLAPQDFSDSAGIQTRADELGNIITDPEQSEPDRADVLYDSSENDRIQSLGGDDIIYAFRGGNDEIEAGEGSDWIAAGAGDDLASGGADSDIVHGGSGNDRLYAGDVVELADAVAQGDSSTGTGERGDWLNGSFGNDTVVGGDGDDVVDGGSGSDILVGGAGDDNILGDRGSTATSFEWSYQDVPSSPTFPFGQRVFEPIVEDGPYAPGNDDIYGGAGNDLIWGDAGTIGIGGGRDYIDAGSGDDTVIGEGGSDLAFGGEGDDTLFGDASYIETAYHGDDYLDGGAGNDILVGEGGNDVLFGGADNDTLQGAPWVRIVVASIESEIQGR